jgi:general secretion pathway protein M
MKARFLDWWRGRSLREQRLLLAMFALLTATFLWLGLYRPIDYALSNARTRHETAVIRLGEVRAQADALMALRKTGLPTLTAPLATLVTQAAREAGFANAAIGAQGDRRATVSIPAARPNALFAWIAGLEARGIIVERLSARANADQTLSVDATMIGGA